jgi:NAD+ synthase (glutamine-hydrolysing)
MRVLAAQINPMIGDLEGNAQKIVDALARARGAADIVLFPELALSGYPPEDLLLDASFIDAAQQQLEGIAPYTKNLFAVIGLPRWNPSKKEKLLYNSAALFADGKLLGFKDKTLLPTYDVFDERRFFEPGAKEQPVWEYRGKKIGVTICEDVWQHGQAVGYTHYAVDPVVELAKKKPDLLLNLSSSPYYFERRDIRLSVFQAAARTLGCPVVLCNQVGANDELVFDGHSLFLNKKGELIRIAKGFAEDDLLVDLEAPAAPCPLPENGIKDLYSALVLGVRDYFRKQGFEKAILGLSGGIDSAVTACIAADALGAKNVSALNLPTRYSSLGSVSDAKALAGNLGIALHTIDIDPLFQAYLDLLKPFFKGLPSDITEENLQSRIRAMVLMAFSNKLGSLLLTTGNKSEMAMGYTTLYGDMAGGLAPLHDVTKLRVYELARFINKKKPLIPEPILEKEPSAELRPHQKTTDAIHPFETLDPILEEYLERFLPVEEIAEKRNLPVDFVRGVVRKIHAAEYKRRQAPISIRVTQKAFSRGRNVPIVQKWM